MEPTAFEITLKKSYSENPHYLTIMKMCKDKAIITNLNLYFTSDVEHKDMLLQALGLELAHDNQKLLEKFLPIKIENRTSMESLIAMESLKDIFCDEAIEKWKIVQICYKQDTAEINKYFIEKYILDWDFIMILAKCNLLSNTFSKFCEPLETEKQLFINWIGALSFLSRNVLILGLNDKALETMLNMTTTDRVRMSSNLLESISKENALSCLSDYSIVEKHIDTDPMTMSLKVRESSFHEAFIDNMHLLERFQHHIDNCIRMYNETSTKYLSPYIAICQASGTGKSRLVKEFAGINPVAYFSFSTGNSYPPRTPVVIDRLLGHIQTNSNIQEIFESFIISAALKVLSKNKKSCSSTHKKKKTKEKEKFWEWEYFDEKIDLSSYIKTHQQEIKKTTAFIVIDEARCLVETARYGTSLFRYFRRALKSADDKLKSIGLRVFGIIMDTASSVANFTPADDPSARAGEVAVLLLPPFYLITTMNCLADTSWPKSLADAFSIRRLASYGRPLIAKFLKYDSKDAETPTNEDDLLKYMKLRILGKSSHTLVDYSTITESERIAVLCSRITLNITYSSQLADSLSSKHLRLITRISKDRRLIYTITPSEPVMSEAAYKIMSDCSNKETFIECLHRQLYMGGVAPGFSGEIISQYLMILTRDKVVYGSESFSLFSVRDFFNTINSECVNAIENVPNTNNECDNAIENVSTSTPPIFNGIMSFNHFTEVKYTPSVEDLTKFFLRMSALQCQVGQAGIDLIIPVLLPQGEYTQTVVAPSTSTRGTKGHNEDLFNKEVFTESVLGNKLNLKKLSSQNKDISEHWSFFQRPCDIPHGSEITPDRMSFILIQVRNKQGDGQSKDAHINPFYAGIIRDKKIKNPYISMKILLRGKGKERFTFKRDEQMLHIVLKSLKSFSFIADTTSDVLLNLLETSHDPLPFFEDELERYEAANLSPGVYKAEQLGSFLTVLEPDLPESSSTPTTPAGRTSKKNKRSHSDNVQLPNKKQKQ
eukprot:gene10203-21267_t